MSWDATTALVDETLLAGPGHEVRLWFGEPVDLATLRRLVTGRHAELTRLGLRPGGSMALWLPPSLEYVATLLAGWRAGAQLVLLDYRLTRHEVDAALARLRPQVLVSAGGGVGSALRGHHPVTASLAALAGRPARTPHALVQLSSGSTGPSKVIGRTAASLAAEIERYGRIAGMPGHGERIVILSSLTHTYGLVGGLLHGLARGAQVVLADQLTSNGIIAAVSAAVPTVVLGVPFHLELMAAVTRAPALPRLTAAICGGEPVRPELPAAFAQRYGVRLGQCYGMTEVGVIAMDPAGVFGPGVGPPAPGMSVRVDAGELLVGVEQTPYLGEADPARWAGGWLRTRDAGTVDPDTGSVRVLGRLDSQVCVGGMKVDLGEVEHTLAGLPGVSEAIVVFDGGIEAYLALSAPATPEGIDEELAGRLAPYKRPRQLHVVPRLPRTPSGKRIRDLASLRAAAGGNGAATAPGPGRPDVFARKGM